MATRGRLYLIDSVPADAGLLGVRAAGVLGRAGAVLYDEGISESVLERCAADSVLLPLPLDSTPGDIAVRAAELTAAHEIVVRLRTGRPGELGWSPAEAAALRDAGGEFVLLPGIPDVIAAATYAAIPLLDPPATMRATIGLEHPESPEIGENVALWATAGEVSGLIGRMLAAGWPPDSAAAAIAKPGHPRQRTRVGTLEELARAGSLSEMSSTSAEPVLLFAGQMVDEREALDWFGKRPLAGRCIVVTRPREQAASLAFELEAAGAEVIYFPTIRIVDPPDPEPLRIAVRQADMFDWIVFTSVNGVERFWQELRAGGQDTRVLAGVSLCAIGPATAAAIEAEGARADLMPDEYVAEAVVDALREEADLAGTRILLPRADIARALLPESLRGAGAEVVEVAAYSTVPDSGGLAGMRQRLRDDGIDVITFTASSTVRSFVDQLGSDIGDAKVATIGPITTATAHEVGLRVAVQASTYTIPGLVSALRTHFGGSA